MSPITWLIIFILITLGFLIFLAALGVFTPPPTSSSVAASAEITSLLAEVSEVTDWGSPEDVPNGTRNLCGIYTLPAKDPNTPTPPTFNSTVLNALTPETSGNIDCLGANQMLAVQQQRVCMGTSTNPKCVDTEGNTYTQGGVWIFYATCDGPAACPNSTISASLAFNFNPMDLSAARCITTDRTKNYIAPCDLTQPGQLLRIERVDAKTLAPDSTGPFARVIDPLTGNCLVPVGAHPAAGAAITFGPCTPNQGYLWFLAPPANLGNPLPSPQQLMYVTSTDTVPPSANFGAYIESNNPLTLRVASTLDSIALQPYTAVVSPTGTDFAGCQYLDYQIYQIIQNTPVLSGSTTNFPFFNW